MLARVIGEDLELVCLRGPGLWKTKVDPGQITQDLKNLAVNARDAMPSGGKLTIETGNVSLDEAYARTHAEVTPGEYVLLAVSDTGEGMGEEARAHVFEPFFTTKAMGKGTGLGLATSYGIVKQSGGHIWYYSERGIGTTFKVYLPRTVEAGEAARPVAPMAAASGHETILLVEDDPQVREYTAFALRSHGYEVMHAPSGADALRAAETGPRIDLLLTDVVMPGLSGRDVAERLQSRWPGIKVLYASGYTADVIVHHGVLDADVQFLPKPFTPEALARKVREVLDAGESVR
jgi:CheY-like chemotaxis protein